jgi:hypothetical protein
MYPPYKRTLTPADRLIFEKWLRGIAAFYGALALLVLSAVAIGHVVGNTENNLAAITESSPPSSAGVP